MKVGISAIGITSPFGEGWDAFANGIRSGVSHIKYHEPLKDLPQSLAGIAGKNNYRKYLKQRKTAKLLTPAAKLGLSSVGQVMEKTSGMDRNEIGLFVAVGREPPDEGAAEAALVASQKDGLLSLERLASKGRDLYPPLLPLKTLPNMILAHISIQFDIAGENGTWAGGASAGVQAFYSGYWALVEGRCSSALVGASDSLVDLGNARDLYRMGIDSPPGEAGIFFLLQHLNEVENPIAGIEWTGKQFQTSNHESQIGYCGAADGLLNLASQLVTLDYSCWGGFQFQSKV